MLESIAIVRGDITLATTDAIVNAANPTLLGGGGVDGAIHRAAGPELRQFCQRIEATDGVRCPVGEARITPAGRLPAAYVIHVVGPRYQLDPVPSSLLASAYRNALVLAEENRCHSIAFPAVSCGAYGYPAWEAAEISLAVCAESWWSGIKVEFHLFSGELVSIWRNTLARCSKHTGGKA